jgi:hypothetical protein
MESSSRMVPGCKCRIWAWCAYARRGERRYPHSATSEVETECHIVRVADGQPGTVVYSLGVTGGILGLSTCTRQMIHQPNVDYGNV